MCTVTRAKVLGEDEQTRALLLGVCGTEETRLLPPGVDGAGVLRRARMADLGVALALALGVLGGAGSLGPAVGVGVVARSMVEFGEVLWRRGW